nr:ROK family transcriptional regulator [Fodinicola feengrottensis]
MQASSSPALLREINCAKVFAALRGRDALRLTEIGELTGLSRPTVSQASEQLVAGGLAEYVEEEAADQPRIGRPARAVRFRRRAGYVLGIDIGPHKILAMLADLTGSVVAKKRRDDDFASSGQQVLAAVRETVTSLLKEAGIARHEVWSVTVGTPGIVDPHTRAVTFAPSLPDWNEIRLADALRRSFSAPIQVENDVNLAVIAERWLGVATGVSTVVFIQWGARVGAGLVIGDRLHRGAAGMAGEIGYLSVLDGQAGVVPDESGLGPLESRVGAGAIIEAAGSRRRRGGRPAGRRGPRKPTRPRFSPPPVRATRRPRRRSTRWRPGWPAVFRLCCSCWIPRWSSLAAECPPRGRRCCRPSSGTSSRSRWPSHC